MNILEQIVAHRRADLRQKGYDPGRTVPGKRSVPLVPFGRDPFLICEIKRKSPSKGDISISMDALVQAQKYRDGGVRSVSILTEPNYFGGSLADLTAVKKQYPDLSVLRKDFLLTPEDIRISYRAGADAVLLIAAILAKEELEEMCYLAGELGMEALVEVHTPEDVEKAAPVKPGLVGINSRDLTSFTIDLCHPLKVKRVITWNPRLVFESGISSREHAVFALSSGFKGLLVGEAVVKNPALMGELIDSFNPAESNSFWERLYGGSRPLVKICGLTREKDVRLADDLGADILGFILAPSPRRVVPEFIRGLTRTRALKAGVVVLSRGEDLPGEIASLLEDGYLDVIQFHGDEKPEDCFTRAFPYYKALRIKDEADVERMEEYRCPRVLVDAFSAETRGGTGLRIDSGLIEKAAGKAPLWLAGGINPGNIRRIVTGYAPELVDVSSGLESAPGIKDKDKVEKFFKELDHETDHAG